MLRALVPRFQLRDVVHVLERYLRRLSVPRPTGTRGYARGFLDKVRRRRAPHLPLERFVLERGDHDRNGYLRLGRLGASATKRFREKNIDDDRCCEGIITHQETRGLGVEFLAEGHDVEAVLRW